MTRLPRTHAYIGRSPEWAARSDVVAVRCAEVRALATQRNAALEMVWIGDGLGCAFAQLLRELGVGDTVLLSRLSDLTEEQRSLVLERATVVTPTETIPGPRAAAQAVARPVKVAG